MTLASIAPSETHLKRRVDGYLWNNPSVPARRLREQLNEFKSLGEIAIIGGMIRDLAREGRSGFKSDVDFVIDCDPDVVEEFALERGASKNRFGGYCFLTPHWKLDFWALERTWARTEGHVKIRRLEDLIKCTFFDVDAIVYLLNCQRLYAREKYLENLLRGEIDINLLPNPSIEGNMVRGIRRILSWNYLPGPRLKGFFEKHLTNDMFAHVVNVERKLYGSSHAAHYGSASNLMDALCTRERRRRRLHGTPWQVSLPF